MKSSIDIDLPRLNSRKQRAGRRVASLVLFAVLAATLAPAALFATNLRDTTSHGGLPPTAVVFTGQFDRVRLGLELLGSGQIRRLFISGVNRGAGLNPETFAQQFHLTGALAGELRTGGIVLATQAQDTLENACETAHWIASQPEVASILLITSGSHMPRATLALARATDFLVPIARLSVDEPGYDTAAKFLTEFLKFSQTLAVSVTPERIWPGDRSGICRKS